MNPLWKHSGFFTAESPGDWSAVQSTVEVDPGELVKILNHGFPEGVILDKVKKYVKNELRAHFLASGYLFTWVNEHEKNNFVWIFCCKFDEYFIERIGC